MRVFLVLLALAIAAPAAAEDDGEYRGACVKHKGTTGVSVSLASCVPVEDDRLDRFLVDVEIGSLS